MHFPEDAPCIRAFLFSPFYTDPTLREAHVAKTEGYVLLSFEWGFSR